MGVGGGKEKRTGQRGKRKENCGRERGFNVMLL